ncbi:MAG: glycosyl transferase group 1 [uncultured bacterium]|uniref:Glycosyl transferase family 1 domain-containing protein n=3 Tax=Candidatus Daviesiibacteriota TaxID=1752718 RepID=A0A1F5K3E5_9BACT|nr:MAG: glycosyl transferase group 1 [uncultured bacterium]KKQ14843.1 MAG: Glycosyl transferase group 1 [Candidatus Daviesbacteria bacterium GW2011_GWA1_36_8]OGE16765.1 MAG: hypothetical protein A2858_04050 [Candidatus Daviesbacteria bacterium RIFCSPHIGHO2_01_FULL_36_37]OGE35288.1 MAG: hypothetical protein A3E66_00305 [Candidatus Daviesbacteria bacterium RIFCSPHIGHO2_12_FULL_37_16]
MTAFSKGAYYGYVNIGYLSFRIAGTDGVSLEAERWKIILERMGHKVTFIAGELDQSGVLIDSLHFTHPEIYKIHEDIITKNIDYKKAEKEIFALSGDIEGELRQVFRQLHIDKLIISNVFSLPIHFPAAVALERVITEFKIPAISRNHDFWWERERYLKSHCFEFFKRFFPPNNPLITHLTINSIAQQELKQRSGIKSRVISDCFDFNLKLNQLDAWTKNWRKDFEIAKDDIVFLQATRIVPRKNIELAIELIKKLNDPRIIFVLAGYHGDESGDYLKKIVRLVKEAGIRTKFIGTRIKSERAVTDEAGRFYTLWGCFVNADFITYPSTFEGFGNQFIEAVYFKKPIFVNRYEVYKKDIEPLGFETVAVDNKVTSDTVNRVRELLSSPEEVERIVKKNFEIGKANFSFEATQKKIEKLGIPNLHKKPGLFNIYFPHGAFSIAGGIFSEYLNLLK